MTYMYTCMYMYMYIIYMYMYEHIMHSVAIYFFAVIRGNLWGNYEKIQGLDGALLGLEI